MPPPKRKKIVPALVLIGVDPGFSGAITSINTSYRKPKLKTWDLPTTGSGKKREFDAAGIVSIFQYFVKLQDLGYPILVLIEWPTTRPGEGAERCKRFGVGMGLLLMACECLGLPYELIPPQTWKRKLGLHGKKVDGYTATEVNRICAKTLDTYYPGHRDLLYGPKKGVKDGRVDAGLIAHYGLVRGVSGLREVVDRFGKGSAEAMALVLGKGRQPKHVMKIKKRQK